MILVLLGVTLSGQVVNQDEALFETNLQSFVEHFALWERRWAGCPDKGPTDDRGVCVQTNRGVTGYFDATLWKQARKDAKCLFDLKEK